MLMWYNGHEQLLSTRIKLILELIVILPKYHIRLHTPAGRGIPRHEKWFCVYLLFPIYCSTVGRFKAGYFRY